MDAASREGSRGTAASSSTKLLTIELSRAFLSMSTTGTLSVFAKITEALGSPTYSCVLNIIVSMRSFGIGVYEETKGGED